MKHTQPAITLIGMAGTGKSTVGAHLAHLLGYQFIDTDVLMEASCGIPIGTLPSVIGDEQFSQLEESVTLTLPFDHSCVVATGGSVVYCPKAMSHLREHSLVLYLESTPEILLQRMGWRGNAFHLVGQKDDMHFLDLYREREHLYKKYAHTTVPAMQFSSAEACAQLIHNLFKINMPHYNTIRKLA